MAKQIMTNEIKLITSLSITPVIADLLEDLIDDNQFNYQTKVQINNLITQIRRIDKRMMDSAGAEAIEQQISIQLAFRQWIKTYQNGDIETNYEIGA
jgi:hypothetical protein